MHYEETQVWDRSGSFSGSGIGIGTGGIGVGVGGGTYREQGQIATKRAQTFGEPSFYLKPVAGVVVFAILLAALVANAPDTISSTFGGAPEAGADVNDMDKVAGKLLDLMHYLIPFVVVAVIGLGVKHAFANDKDNDRVLEVDYPRQLDRYNEMQYCAHCNRLYDRHGRSEPANQIGFNRMLALGVTS